MENNFNDNNINENTNENIDINEGVKAVSEDEVLEAAEALAKAKQDDIKSWI